MEQQIYIQSEKRLFGMLFCPEHEHKKNKAFLLIHPFAEEKKSAQRTLVDISRTLYESGYAVLMFDLQGYGDSEGNFASVRLDDWLKDIDCAINYLRGVTGVSSISCIGLRFGAYLILRYEYLYRNITEFILIEPVFEPISYFRQILRQKLIKELCTQGNVISSRNQLLNDLQSDKNVDFDGYEIGADLYCDLVNIRNDEEVVLIKEIPCLIISVSLKNHIPEAIRKAYSSNIIYKHVRLEQFWNKVNEVNTSVLISEIVDYVNNRKNE